MLTTIVSPTITGGSLNHWSVTVQRTAPVAASSAWMTSGSVALAMMASPARTGVTLPSVPMGVAQATVPLAMSMADRRPVASSM